VTRPRRAKSTRGGARRQQRGARRTVGLPGTAETAFRAADPASHEGCPAAWTAPRPLHCWPTSALTGTGRSPDSCSSPGGALPMCSSWPSPTWRCRRLDQSDRQSQQRSAGLPLDPDVAALIQANLFAARPDTASQALFVAAKGPHREPSVPGLAAHHLPADIGSRSKRRLECIKHHYSAVVRKLWRKLTPRA
jgi:hypothetical protein